MRLPATNATLTELAGGGTSANYDQDASAGTPTWSGSESAYLVEKLTSIYNAERGALDRVRQSYLVVPYELVAFAVLGGTATFTNGDGNSQTRTVQNVERHEIAGTARLWLADAPKTST